MRDIKYRMYDNEDKTFIYFTLKEAITKEVELFVDSDIEEWVGLKDKNGTEIYEGDIVKYTATFFDSMLTSMGYGDVHASKEVTIIGEIYWSERDCAFFVKDNKEEQIHSFDKINFKKIEIIGNVYETK